MSIYGGKDKGVENIEDEGENTGYMYSVPFSFLSLCSIAFSQKILKTCICFGNGENRPGQRGKLLLGMTKFQTSLKSQIVNNILCIPLLSVWLHQEICIIFLCPSIERSGAYCFTVCPSVRLSVRSSVRLSVCINLT